MDIRFAHQFIRVENNHLVIEFLGDEVKLPMDKLALREIRTRGNEGDWFGREKSELGFSVATFDMSAQDACVYGLVSTRNMNLRLALSVSNHINERYKNGESKRD